MKSSENRFHFYTCILPDYVACERLKEFWKNSHFENMIASFLLKGQLILKFIFVVFKSPKKNDEIFSMISAIAPKK